jgi:hypothetical protein
MTNELDEANQDAELHYEDLYEKYGKPLEAEHAGEYLALTKTGEAVIGPTDIDVIDRAEAAFGPGFFLYRICQRWVYSFRSPRVVQILWP